MKKRIIILLCSLLIFMSMSVSSFAWSGMPLLVDSADLLSDSEESWLLEDLEEISARNQMDIAVVTVDSLQGYSPRDFADDFYDYNGYAEDGILLLISMEDRDWYISTAGYGITAITEDALAYIEDEFINDLSEGYYYDAFSTYADLCDQMIAQAKSGNPYKEPFPALTILIISLVIGFIVALIATGTMKGKLKTVRAENAAANYVRNGSFNVTNSRDLFLYAHMDRRPRPKDNDSRSSGVHTSSSGRSHGGGGGKF